MDATLNYLEFWKSPDKQKGVQRYSSSVSLSQEATATVCWPSTVCAHIRPACLQIDILDPKTKLWTF